MNNPKIVRTVCTFTQSPNLQAVSKLDEVVAKLELNGYSVQTKRVASNLANIDNLLELETRGIEYLSIGAISLQEAREVLPRFYEHKALTFNVELAKQEINLEHVALLQNIIANNASRTFSFTYTFNNAASSPYFPSARYEQEGFAIGLQPTDLSNGCTTLESWLDELRSTWDEICVLFKD
jgi:hypothetical protein